MTSVSGRFRTAITPTEELNATAVVVPLVETVILVVEFERAEVDK